MNMQGHYEGHLSHRKPVLLLGEALMKHTLRELNHEPSRLFQHTNVFVSGALPRSTASL